MFTLVKINPVFFWVFSFCFSAHLWGQQSNLDKQRVALQGYDVVSYFQENKAVLGNNTLTSEFKGAFIIFLRWKTRHGLTPRSFVPQYGGWCASDVQRKKSIDRPGAF